MSGASPPGRSVVIEGIGGILSFNVLTPILVSFKAELANNPGVRLIGTDLGSKLTPRGLDAIRELKECGMIYINKDDTTDVAMYDALQVDCVYIVTPPHTHIPLLNKWLDREKPPKVILVEKPFTEDPREMAELMLFLQANPHIKTKILAIDSADTFPLHKPRSAPVEAFLGTVTSMTFFWVHDLSGADSRYVTRYSEADQPNTRMDRFNFTAEERRQVFDALIHFFNPLEFLVYMNNVKLLQVKAAQYEHADIVGETFVAAKLALESISGDSIEATLYAGCGIGGIKSLDLECGHMLVLSNAAGRQVRMSIDKSTVTYVESDGTTIREDPQVQMYKFELHNLLFGNPEIGHSLEHTVQCLHILDQIRARINDHLRTGALPTYPLGTKQKPAPSLEAVLDLVPALGATSADQLRADHLLELGNIVSDRARRFAVTTP